MGNGKDGKPSTTRFSSEDKWNPADIWIASQEYITKGVPELNGLTNIDVTRVVSKVVQSGVQSTDSGSQCQDADANTLPCDHTSKYDRLHCKPHSPLPRSPSFPRAFTHVSMH